MKKLYKKIIHKEKIKSTRHKPISGMLNTKFITLWVLTFATLSFQDTDKILSSSSSLLKVLF